MSNNTEALIAEMKAAAEKLEAMKGAPIVEYLEVTGRYDSLMCRPENTLALIAALEQSQQSGEVAELLRDKVKRLESDLWDKEQLRKVYSEKSFDLESTISSMKHEHAKNQSWLAGQVREMEDALWKLLPGSQYMDEPDGGDVSPADQITRMVSDYRNRIAELESCDRIEYTRRLERRVAELEASRLAVKLPEKLKDTDRFEDYMFNSAIDKCAKAIRAAGITVQGDE